MMGQTTDQVIRINSVIESGRLKLVPWSENRFDIQDTKTGQSLGMVQQGKNSIHQIELFFGKGGFMVILTSPKGARYFALPGSSIRLEDIELVLEGCAITSNPAKKSSIPRPIQIQKQAKQATILGAGLATRFERISGDSTDYSKPAVPLIGKHSVIACIANSLTDHGFERLIVNTYFKPESLKTSLGFSKAKRVDYIDEHRPSGTAGGLRKMLLDPQYKGLLDETQPLLVVQGDAVTDASFSDLMNAHIEQRALITIGCQEVDSKDVDKFGIIVTDHSGADGLSGRITGFQEKPQIEQAKSRLGNTGFYIFSPKCYPLIREIYTALLESAQAKAKAVGGSLPSEIPFDFALDLFPAILQRIQENSSLGIFWAQTVDGYWSDIGNPVQYLESIHDLYSGKANLMLPDNPQRFYRNGIVFWDGAFEIAVQEQAQLHGNVVVAMPFRST